MADATGGAGDERGGRGFLAAQQMAISQMAIEYCSALVDNNGQVITTPVFLDKNGQQAELFGFQRTPESEKYLKFDLHQEKPFSRLQIF